MQVLTFQYSVSNNPRALIVMMCFQHVDKLSWKTILYELQQPIKIKKTILKH